MNVRVRACAAARTEDGEVGEDVVERADRLRDHA
jgi:hypothetical protein